MIKAKNLKEFKNCLYDIMSGMYSSFEYEGTKFDMDEEIGSILMTNGSKKKNLFPENEDADIDELIDEVVIKYEEFIK